MKKRLIDGIEVQQGSGNVYADLGKVSDLMRGDFANLSERKLMDCLTRLGYDIEISVRPASTALGHLMLAVA